MDFFPQSLKAFLSDSNVTFAGVEVSGDVTKLKNEHGLECCKTADIRALAMQRWPGRFRYPGLKELASEVVGLNMKKPKHITMSNWESRLLHKRQIEYACIDAYASYKIGHKLITDKIAPESEEPVNEGEKFVDGEKLAGKKEASGDGTNDSPMDKTEEKGKERPEDKTMTLKEYERVLEEKRKAKLAIKPVERKVNIEKELENMQLLSNKNNDDEIFIKLGSDKHKTWRGSWKGKEVPKHKRVLKAR